MYKPFKLLAILFMAYSPVFATETHPVGGRSIALSNALVSVSDTWSTFHNQAGIASFSHLSGGLFYESRFMIEELSLVAGSIILPTGNGNFGFSLYQFGQGTFKEHKLGLTYARQLSAKLNAALQIDYFSQRYPENEKAVGFPTFEFGMTYAISKECTLGAHVFNPIQNGFTFRDRKEKMAAIYRLGGHYLFSDHVLLSAEFEQAGKQKTTVKTGLEFWPLNNLALRMGVSGKPVRYTTGLGYRFGRVSTDFAFSYHGNLGLSPSVSVQFSLK